MTSNFTRPIVLTIVAISAAVASFAAQVQPPRKKPFDVASVKPVKTRGITNRVTADGGRFNSPIATALGLVQWAYRPPGPGPTVYNEYQIIGGPDWFAVDRFAVEAKSESGSGRVSAEEMQEMLQSLLEDRFQLKVHRETRQMPAYNLVVAKGGLKMKLSEDQTPPHAGQRGQRGLRGRIGLNIADSGTGAFKVTLTGTGVSIPVLISRVQEGVDRQIVDKTGLDGLYDFSVKFNVVPGPNGGEPTEPDVFVGLVTALQDLGLKLESTSGPNSVLVIDSVRKPTEN